MAHVHGRKRIGAIDVLPRRGLRGFRLENSFMTIASATTKSLSIGHAGLSLVLVAAGVLALYAFVATTLDVQFLAQGQGEAQAMANAAAAASVVELPKGT